MSTKELNVTSVTKNSIRRKRLQSTWNQFTKKKYNLQNEIKLNTNMKDNN